ncbi:hypothetical protein P7K49_020175 [Saguinus oedipus]|uniref:Uncharacterized protein n=1 Tax=Saguinus oedipus TaxID=9490 RepID=A0ABQ9UZK9_SAGOE|nr:hypothetical protein P7K49_020175 [Saguinus oedipus]
MPSAKQRGSKGGHGAASPSEKGAHPSGGVDDVAKKPPPAPQQQQQQPPPPASHPQQHPQNQAHGKGSHRGGGGGGGKSSAAAAAASSSASCSRRLGRVLNFLFYLALVAAAAFSGWCVHHVLEEVQQVRRSHQDFSRQREELGQGLQGVEQKVGTPDPPQLSPPTAASGPTAGPPRALRPVPIPACPGPEAGAGRSSLAGPGLDTPLYPVPLFRGSPQTPFVNGCGGIGPEGWAAARMARPAWQGGPRACHRALAVTCKEADSLYKESGFQELAASLPAIQCTLKSRLTGIRGNMGQLMRLCLNPFIM